MRASGNVLLSITLFSVLGNAQSSVEPRNFYVSPIEMGTIKRQVRGTRQLAYACVLGDKDEGKFLVVIHDGKPGAALGPAIGIFSGGNMNTIAELSEMLPYAEDFKFVDAKAIEPYAGRQVVGISFGGPSTSARFFVVITATGDRWKIEMSRGTTQGQIRSRESGRLLELRYADQEQECNICPHRYRSEIYALDAGSMAYSRRPGLLDLGVQDPRAYLRTPIIVSP